jgi:very-short-patch-repair endonuclease
LEGVFYACISADSEYDRIKNKQKNNMAHRRTNQRNMVFSKILRHNPTDAEAALWRCLRMGQLYSIHFRRQHAIGPYIVDFCSIHPKLVIELDGGQHSEQQLYDSERTAFLNSQGYLVLRFWNNDVLQKRDAVLLVIMETIERLNGGK